MKRASLWHGHDSQPDAGHRLTKTDYEENFPMYQPTTCRVFLFAGTILLSSLAFADDEELDELYRKGGACTRTSIAALRSCKLQHESESWLTRGKCNNLADPAKREKCETEAIAAIEVGEDECDEQYDARQALCKALGEDAYEPKFDPSMFVKPADIGKSVQPNPYFPLVPGRTLIYQGGGQTITYAVTAETREILGVRCTVIRDVVTTKDGVLEDTIDWYAQDNQGNVWYFGEVAQNFEDGRLANLGGSWFAGVDGAKPGIIMKANPATGNLYRQEFFLGSAEDMSEVTSITGTTRTPAAACVGNCLVTRDFSPVEPGVNTTKTYAPGIGLIAEENPVTKVRKELVEIKN